EERLPRRGKFHHRIPQSRPLQCIHACIERTYAGQDQALRLGHRLRSRHDTRIHAQLAQHIEYRAGIANTVVEDAHLCHCACPRAISLVNPSAANTSKGMKSNPPERNAVNADVTCNWNKPYMPLPRSATASGVLPRLMTNMSTDFTT